MQIPITVKAEIDAGDTPGTVNLVLSITLKDGTVLDSSPPMQASVGASATFGPIMVPILEGGGFGSGTAPQSMPAHPGAAANAAARPVAGATTGKR